jgi:hypothetical protein
VSPYSWNNPSATTLSIIAVAWFVIVMIGSFLVGGYFAGRFRTPIELRSAEREIRDGAHGLLVWALDLPSDWASPSYPPAWLRIPPPRLRVLPQQSPRSASREDRWVALWIAFCARRSRDQPMTRERKSPA